MRESAKSDAKTAQAMLERAGTKKARDGMARYGIAAPKAFGVPVGGIKQIAKKPRMRCESSRARRFNAA